jgi:hypothetical protein
MQQSKELINVINKTGHTSINAFAKEYYLEPSLITRVRNGIRSLGRTSLEGISRADASALDIARLWWSAGYVPPELQNLELDQKAYDVLLALAKQN